MDTKRKKGEDENIGKKREKEKKREKKKEKGEYFVALVLMLKNYRVLTFALTFFDHIGRKIYFIPIYCSLCDSVGIVKFDRVAGNL